MTPEQMRDARGTLGQQWGLGRPLTMNEMGRALRLTGRNPGANVRDYERGHSIISGPLSALIELYLAGAQPVGGLAVIGRQDETPQPQKNPSQKEQDR